jgi:hypothetical protein
MRVHAHVRLEEDGVVAVADGPILASAADAHVLDLGVARRHTAARPRRHRIVAAVDRAGTVRRAAVIRTDRTALPSKVRVWRNVLRYCLTKSSSALSSSSSGAGPPLCA